MYSRKMVQSSKHRVLKVTWERCCDLAWKASRRSLHRDHTSVLARNFQGAKATPNRGRGRQGAQARKNWPPRLHENSQCFVTCHKKLKMSGCISEKKWGCISEKKLGCISDPHAFHNYDIHWYPLSFWPHWLVLSDPHFVQPDYIHLYPLHELCGDVGGFHSHGGSPIQNGWLGVAKKIRTPPFLASCIHEKWLFPHH